MNYEYLIKSISQGSDNYFLHKGKAPEVIIMHPVLKKFLTDNMKIGMLSYTATISAKSDDEYIMGMLIRSSWAIQENTLVFAPSMIEELKIDMRPQKADYLKNKGE